MKSVSIGFVAAQGLALALVGAALALFPGADFALTLAAMAAVWLVVYGTYRIVGDNTAVGRYWLLTLTTALAVGIVVNVYTVTTLHGADTAHPSFGNPDMARYYYGAAHLLDPSEGWWEGRSQIGFCSLVLLLWRVTGWSLVPALVCHMLLTMLTVVLAGRLTLRLLDGRVDWPRPVLMTTGMVAAGVVTYFTFSGTLMMKESLTAFCLTVAALSVLAVRDGGRWQWIWWCCFVVSSIVLWFVRHYWVVIPIAGLLLGLKRNWRSMAWVVSTAVVLIVFCVMAEDTFLSDDSVAVPQEFPKYLDRSFLNPSAGREGYYTFLERLDYFHLPWWRRCLLLPLTAAVQFLIPFPWNYTVEVTSSPTLALVKFSYPWYLVGGLVIYYILFCARRSPGLLLGVTLWGVAFWLGFALLGGGTVSRYGFNLLPMLVPAAVYALAAGWGRRSFKRWWVVYPCCLAVALVSAYILQHNGWTT